MADPRFVHLRLHSEYSVTDGIVRLDDAVARAAGEGMPALALTDNANLFGMVKFYKAACAAGVKPVLGADCWIQNETDRDKPSRLLLLCASREGYLKLSTLLSRAWRSNQHRARAEIARSWFGELGTDGLIALSGAAAGDVGQALTAGNAAAAERNAAAWAELFPGRYYLELQRAGFANAESLLVHTLALAANAGIPVVATHPVQFLAREDFRAHEARVCIAAGYLLGDQRRPRHYTPEQYWKSQDEMVQLFADLPQALENTVEIARRCSFALELGRNRLPDFPTPQGVGIDQYLRQESEGGLARRLERLFPEAAQHAQAALRYYERLEFEIRTIVQMGFAGYFLIVADFINWARRNGVPVGPGRGSGAGSLVAYALGITDLDPIRYDLLFERFLNPERVSMPDFDIDFCQDGRDRVIDYVRNKYGAESVSQIATFGTLAARAVVRDTGRVLDLGYNFCDQVAKLIPVQPGQSVTLADARRLEPLLAERERNEDDVRELLALGGKLEGLTRNVGMHAGGVLIAPGKLTDYCPLYAAEGTANVISQLDKDDVEAIGLVKFDFLGLTTLTILDWAERYVRQLGQPDFAVDAIPLNDPQTYALLAAGNAAAVFQFESRGMRDLLKQAPPARFEDVIALVALYRPGPMELIPDYVACKQGRKRVEYVDPRLEPILGPTYGVMVYQEQVMQIAQVIGGYTLGGADLLRRAMGKKNQEEMDNQRDIFVAGAEKNGLARGRAMQLFDLMAKFAGYGFNKSHAAAYALLAYQTAYLKAHHLAAFMAANLSAVMDDTDKVRQMHDDALANGLRIRPPDINASDYRFVPVDHQTVRYGLGAVRGTGASAVEAIVAARKAGPFSGLFEFCRRVDKRHLNRRAIEALVRAGAFDALEPDRARLLASTGRAIEAAEQAERRKTQSSLFGEADAAQAEREALLDANPWDLKQRLVEEKLALGFNISGHLFSVYEGELAGLPRQPLAQLAPAEHPVLVAGIVVEARPQMTRRGRMMVVKLEDRSAQLDVTVYSELLDAQRERLKTDALLLVRGKVQRDMVTGGVRMIADELLDLAAVRARYAARLRIAMNGQADAQRLKELLTPYLAADGPACAVVVHYENGNASCDVALGATWRVRPDDRLISELQAWLAPENVQVVYGTAAQGG
ncbi:MAG: DNA polymerase III subunit alpha [Betaproteobacteria bacterium RIFCSPLOWO2_02_FULL_67_19]|nr:MAG: DNA polymerase III subunit alpha [Betaproteobacteria bacterium RIFCSPLOWO2_02_FULL_67_19]